jgi:hypothetical protein
VALEADVLGGFGLQGHHGGPRSASGAPHRPEAWAEPERVRLCSSGVGRPTSRHGLVRSTVTTSSTPMRSVVSDGTYPTQTREQKRMVHRFLLVGALAARTGCVR